MILKVRLSLSYLVVFKYGCGGVCTFGGGGRRRRKVHSTSDACFHDESCKELELMVSSETKI